MVSAEPRPAARWRVARAGPGDAAHLAALGAGALARGWSVASLEAELSRPDAAVWVVGEDARAETAGFLLARLVAGEIHVLLVAVEAAARRRGAGSALLEAALAWARAAGAGVAHLEVRATNRTARRFYARRGFLAVGRRPRYYEGREDAVLMSRKLGAEGAPR